MGKASELHWDSPPGGHCDFLGFIFPTKCLVVHLFTHSGGLGQTRCRVAVSEGKHSLNTRLKNTKTRKRPERLNTVTPLRAASSPRLNIDLTTAGASHETTEEERSSSYLHGTKTEGGSMGGAIRLSVNPSVVKALSRISKVGGGEGGNYRIQISAAARWDHFDRFLVT